MTVRSLERGDGIDVGDGCIGIITKVLSSGCYRVSWPGASSTVVVPDSRAIIHHRYFALLVEDVETAAARRRSAAVTAGWATRRGEPPAGDEVDESSPRPGPSPPVPTAL